MISPGYAGVYGTGWMELAPRASTGSMDSPTIVLLRAPKGREDAYEKVMSR